MRIRAVSVFEGIVYHCWPVDLSNPTRPHLEVDAILRPGDADASAGPLLLSVADYIAMVGDLDVAREGLVDLAAAGRIVEHLTAEHIAFPTWSRVAADGIDDTPDRHGGDAPLEATPAEDEDPPAATPAPPRLRLIAPEVDEPGRDPR